MKLTGLCFCFLMIFGAPVVFGGCGELCQFGGCQGGWPPDHGCTNRPFGCIESVCPGFANALGSDDQATVISECSFSEASEEVLSLLFTEDGKVRQDQLELIRKEELPVRIYHRTEEGLMLLYDGISQEEVPAIPNRSES